MPKRQGRDDFGLNFQTGKDGSAEIQTNFYIVILIKMTANELSFADLAVRSDDDFPTYSSFQLPSASRELDLRYSPVVILVEFGKLCRFPDRKRQRNLQTISAGTDGEAA